MRLSGRTGRDGSGNARVLFHMARMINARATSLQVREDKSKRVSSRFRYEKKRKIGEELRLEGKRMKRFYASSKIFRNFLSTR